jgi:hypothetical protein
MQKKSYQINDLKKCRYQVTASHNATQVIRSSTVHASSTWELTLNLTYHQLIEKLQQHFHLRDTPGGATSARQQYRNHLSTLHSYLAFAGKTTDARIGTELRGSFDETLRGYLGNLNVAPRTKRDRRSHLHVLRRIAEAALQPDRVARPTTALSVELRQAISKTGLAPKTLAKKIGVHPSAMQRLLAGASPNRRGIPALHRLEAELGMPRDHLFALVRAEATTVTPVPPIAYREALKQGNRRVLSLSEDKLSAEFQREWWALYEYKTAALTRLERSKKGVWRTVPIESVIKVGPLTHRGRMACPTASASLTLLSDFLGVVTQLPSEDGGLSVRGERQQTLAWCAHPQALSAHLQHLTERSQGVRNSAHKTFCAFLCSLLRPETGYLWQQPQFNDRLPEECRAADAVGWRQLCEKSYRMLNDYKSTATGVSRDPSAPIADLLECEQPLQPLLLAINAVEREACAARAGSVEEARLRRDALLLSMLLSNPLRLRVFVTMTWNALGTGMLRGNGQQGFRVALQAHHIKNGAGRAGKDYSVRVAEWLQPRLVAYLEEYRETLLKGRSSPYLFASSQTANKWTGMGQHIAKLTRRYIPGCPGFGAHAFRHLVASAWLQAYPNDYLTVAELLNDRLETVIKSYAHLKRDTSFSRYEGHINALLTE